MPLTGRWTLTRYLIEERRRYPQASGELNALIREDRVREGVVDDARIVEGSDGLSIGRGDLIQTRRNNSEVG
ncbi:MAG TPA: hypothetical protein PLT38_12315, partial [Rubrivivax sp.]|nr:hypothetical protein [Rubrivivax sp.]